MEGVLLQEAEADDPGDLERQLLVVRKDVVSDQLDDLHQAAFLVQDGHQLIPVVDEIRPHIVRVPACQVRQVFAVAAHPVDGGEVSGIGQVLVQSPEAAHKTLGVLGDGLGKIASLGGYGADNGDASLVSVQGLHHARALVKSGQAAGQVGREAFLGGHFLQTAGQLAQRLRPAGGGVGHDGHMVAHVAVIFRKGQPGINAGLTGRDGHVGGIGDQHGPVHQGIAGLGIDQLGEILQYLGHFIAALSAADVYDDISIRPFGDGMLGHGLSGTEAAGDGGRASLGNGEQGVQDTLPGHQRTGRGKALRHRAGHTDGPLLDHGQGSDRFIGLEYRHQRLVDGIASVRDHGLHGSRDMRGHHDLMHHGRGLLHLGDDGPAVYLVSGLHAEPGFPFFLPIQGIHGKASVDIGAGPFRDLGKRPLDAVKNIRDDAGSKGHRKGSSRGVDGFAGLQAGGLFKNLDRGHFAV